MAKERDWKARNAGVLTCWATPPVAQRFQALAASMGVTVSSLLARLVETAIENPNARLDVIEEVRAQAQAEVRGPVALVVRRSLVPCFRLLNEYHRNLEGKRQKLFDAFRDLEVLTQDVAAYAEDLKPLIEQYAPDALEHEVNMDREVPAS